MKHTTTVFSLTFIFIKDSFCLGVHLRHKSLLADHEVMQESNSSKPGIGACKLAESEALDPFPADNVATSSQDLSYHRVGCLFNYVT